MDDHALYDLLSLRNDNGDGNKNFKSNSRISISGQQLLQHTFFVHFFRHCMTSTLVFFQATISSGRKDRMRDDKRVGIIAKKFEKKPGFFNCNVFAKTP